jgi:selenocysteine lyase/cysteine desulfurase
MKLPRDEAAIRREWPGAGGYLNTAAYGLPPLSAAAAMRAWIDEWQTGRVSFSAWLPTTDAARDAFAAILGVDPADVATGASVSQLVGLVAGSLPVGARVVLAEDEFSSLLFPFLAQAARGLDVELAPTERLVDAIRPGTTAVAFSLVKSHSGELVDHAAIREAAAAASAMTIVDAAQACGWLDVDYWSFDFVVCAPFKWLMSPRGTSFLYVRPGRLDGLISAAAGWYASEGRNAYYGGPLRLAESTRRLDMSPAWPSWAGTTAALKVIREIGVPAIGEHNLRLANRLRAGLGLATSNSPIVLLPSVDAAAALSRAGFVVSAPSGSLRLSVHWYSSADDMDSALEILKEAR